MFSFSYENISQNGKQHQIKQQHQKQRERERGGGRKDEKKPELHFENDKLDLTLMCINRNDFSLMCTHDTHTSHCMHSVLHV